MDLMEARDVILVEHLKEDVELIAEEIVYERKDKERIKLFKSLMRTIQYYSKHHDYKEYCKTLAYVPKEYFPNE